MRWRWLILAALVAFRPVPAAAQAFEVLGTRAAGMGGAFVAVADDASAVYWNPGGLAKGSYFSLVLDGSSGEAEPDDTPGLGTGSRSGGMIAMAVPALGASYYRLRSSTRRPIAGTNQTRLENLITHHTGVTLVQSLTQHIAVGGTLKYVRGAAAAGIAPDIGTDDPRDVVGRSSNHFDADLGVSAVFGTVRAGVTFRNLTEPAFDTLTEDDAIRLERQGRAGVAIATPVGVLVAVDADLMKTHGSLGEERNLALGAEKSLSPRIVGRAGVRINTVDTPAGLTPAVAVGGTLAATGTVLIDGQYTTGSREADRGWGVAARIVF